eukprot:Opistho-2@77262
MMKVSAPYKYEVPRMAIDENRSQPVAMPSQADDHQEVPAVKEQPKPVILYDATSGRTYLKGKFLGKGGFAKCYELIEQSKGFSYAGKVVSKESLAKNKTKQKLASEIRIHRSLHHKHIVRFEHYFEDKQNVYIVLEMCHNKSMMDLLKKRERLTEPEARYYFLQILSAIEYMHKNKVIHRDLKLGNLFLNADMEIKVGDFGLATTVDTDGERKRTLCGTPNYIAPEILDGSNGHSFEVDIWSLGVILYTLLFGRPPFETESVKSTYQRIRLNQYTFPDCDGVSNAAIALIKAMLSSDPSARPSLAKIREDPFFRAGFTFASLSTAALLRPPTIPASSGAATTASMGMVPAFSPVPLLKRQGSERTVVPAQPATTAGALATIMPLPLPQSRRRPLADVNSDGVVPIGGQTVAQKQTLASAMGVERRQGSASPPERPVRSARAGGNLPDVARPPSGVLSAPLRPVSAAQSQHATGSLEDIHSLITESLSKRSAPAGSAGPLKPSSVPPLAWISKWVDYSNKYGLGYQLCDGSLGVLFNDSTKMILSNDGSTVHYCAVENSGNFQRFRITEYPPDLAKKITLLKYFQSYMNEHLVKAGSADLHIDDQSSLVEMPCHVMKWLRTKHAIIFRLSKSIIQMNFFDHTKVIVSTGSRTVTLIDKSRNASTYTLTDAASGSVPELQSRLKYCKGVLEHLIAGDDAKIQVKA